MKTETRTEFPGTTNVRGRSGFKQDNLLRDSIVWITSRYTCLKRSFKEIFAFLIVYANVQKVTELR